MGAQVSCIRCMKKVWRYVVIARMTEIILSLYEWLRLFCHCVNDWSYFIIVWMTEGILSLYEGLKVFYLCMKFCKHRHWYIMLVIARRWRGKTRWSARHVIVMNVISVLLTSISDDQYQWIYCFISLFSFNGLNWNNHFM